MTKLLSLLRRSTFTLYIKTDLISCLLHTESHHTGSFSNKIPRKSFVKLFSSWQVYLSVKFTIFRENWEILCVITQTDYMRKNHRVTTIKLSRTFSKNLTWYTRVQKQKLSAVQKLPHNYYATVEIRFPYTTPNTGSIFTQKKYFLVFNTRNMCKWAIKFLFTTTPLRVQNQ